MQNTKTNYPLLRSYQKDAVSKMMWDMGNPGNSIVCLPTGSGKSLVIADFVHKLGQPVLILQPSKELLEQNVNKILQYVDKSEVNVYSASMDRKDVGNITFGTIQSMYKHPELFQDFDVAIVDEGDLIPIKKLNGMYRKFFKQAGIRKIYGLTATPFRQDTYYKEPPQGWNAWKANRWKNYSSLELATTTKMLTRYKEMFWSRMLVVVNTHELVPKYLSPLQYIDKTVLRHEEIPANLSKSDFDWEAFDTLIEKHEEKIIEGIQWAIDAHKSVLVFCATITQAERMSAVFPQSRIVTAKTKKKEREQIIADLRSGATKCVFNVSVLTVGFDYPELDCIVLARPTKSLRLHCQILGRGTRKAEGKINCSVIDFVGNVANLGRLESIKIQKVNGMWDVVSDAQPQGMHMKELFSYTIAFTHKE